MNALTSPFKNQRSHTKNTKSTSSTIRSVPSERLPSREQSQDESIALRRSVSPTIVVPHATATDADVIIPPAPTYTPPIPPIASATAVPSSARKASNSIGLSPVSTGVVRRISSEFGPTRSISTLSGINAAADEHSDINGTNGSITSPSNSEVPQWSSAVGKSTLGKSGRVIEKLQGQLDTMRRELTTEKLNAVEHKNQVALAELKLCQQREEYDIALHDAAITKTSLKRRERQVAEMKAQIESEKGRADKAVEREKGWKEQMEEVQKECMRKVEEAQLHAALMEGRVKVMTSHWQDQGAEVNRTVKKVEKQIKTIVEERRVDDGKISTLQGLCDQQAEQLSGLQREKEAIEKKFEEYKAEQERLLKDIKRKAKEQEEACETKLQETGEVLGKLKWALGVKENVKGI